MVALRLVRLLETHSDKIAANLASKIRASARMMDVQEVRGVELLVVIRDLLQHLREWLLGNRETTIAAHYHDMGAHLAAQEVAPAQICWMLVITKEHLWKFLQEQELPSPIELYGEMELLWLLSQFFDRALCSMVEGYGQSDIQRHPQPKYPEVNLGNWVP
jgi:hypothetical protein